MPRLEAAALELEHLEELLSNRDMKGYFTLLGLHVENPEALFRLLDFSGEGSISVDEFVEGCMRLKGDAQSMAVAELSMEHRHLMSIFKKFRGFVASHLKALEQALDASEANPWDESA